MRTRPNILVSRIEALGDVVMTTPVIRRLHTMHAGECNIHVRTAHTDVFRNNPWVASAFRLDESPPCKFDIVYRLDRCYEKNRDMHVVDAYERYVLGAPSTSGRHCELFEDENDRRVVEDVVRDIGPYILLHMRNSRSSKPEFRAKDVAEPVWRSVVLGLMHRTTMPILQIGSDKDLVYRGHRRLLDLRERLNLQQIKVLAGRAACHLGSDSGPAHIEACSGVSMVVLYTVARPEFFQPIRQSGAFRAIPADIAYQGCMSEMPTGATSITCHRGDVACRERFAPEQVVDAVRAAVEQAAPNA